MSENNTKSNDLKQKKNKRSNKKNKITIEKPHKRRKITQKAPISTEMLKKANRRQKQPDKAQKAPHTTNAKTATARQR